MANDDRDQNLGTGGFTEEEISSMKGGQESLQESKLDTEPVAVTPEPETEMKVVGMEKMVPPEADNKVPVGGELPTTPGKEAEPVEAPDPFAGLDPEQIARSAWDKVQEQESRIENLEKTVNGLIKKLSHR